MLTDFFYRFKLERTLFISDLLWYYQMNYTHDHRLMRLFYNILQLLLSPLLALYLLYIYFARKEKWQALLPRLGYGLKSFQTSQSKSPVIWIHALSVGETTSAIPLVTEIVREEPDTCIVLSATTTSGRKLAEEKLGSLVDTIVPFPLDIAPVVKAFINIINPDLFILVETDFWPNLLSSLHARNIPALLVNGRISEKSMNKYRRFRFFFTPMFNHFTSLCMQTAVDAENMNHLGISKNKLETLGNLKYRPGLATRSESSLWLTPPPENLFILCGSTHPGEEDIILEAYKKLISSRHHLNLAIAPRQPSRTDDIARLAERFNLSTKRYSARPDQLADLLLIDTIGDLAELYSLCDIAFIGGSLVSEGGHNPLEASFHGIPCLFGPHMDDFREISQELISNRAAFQVSVNTLLDTLERLIDSEQLRKDTGENANRYMSQHKNVIPAHLAIIRKYL
jgi:3-deoxy-D-manno-octulosonic-acid transferase